MSDASSSPLKDALQRLESEPITDGAQLGVVADRVGGAGVVGAVSTTLGKGWSLNAKGQWQHKTGWSVAAVARWTKGQ